MRRARRAIPAILLAGAWLLAGGDAAWAHALLGASDPASGASLDRAPRAVLTTFTERPDPGLSSVRVLDQSGREVTAGKAALVPGRPLQLRAPLRDGLPNGVYSVVWRVLSRDDGHLTTGSFSFGVGVDPSLVATPQSGAATSSPPPSPLGVAGRWLLYWGLALLVGGAATGLAVFGGSLPAWRGRGGDPGQVLLAAFGLGVVGLAGIALGEWASAGASLRSLAASSVGQSLLRQGAALAVPGLAVGPLVAAPGRPRRRGRHAGPRRQRPRRARVVAALAQPPRPVDPPGRRRRLGRRPRLAAAGDPRLGSAGTGGGGQALLAAGGVDRAGDRGDRGRPRPGRGRRLGTPARHRLRPRPGPQGAAVRRPPRPRRAEPPAAGARARY
jgi:methionine-rich copper-binding protein CopC